ncbi:PhyR family response regulator anti-anti-sigma factor [Henriciella marina]|uniref:PhyR family response regulator anti-anti-sigma factor n=1 Tax=Henriciella marina TaxID=453851 RepID=UPI000477404C|nr:response regulator [Henriciella marina]
MGTADNLERELPYLRRYTRAVTGSSMQGDALVETALAPFRKSGAEAVDRVGLFRRVEEMINAAFPEKTATVGMDPASRSRRALLLTVMEGFPVSDAATIMACDAAEVSELVRAAENDLPEALATTVFVIEDEPLVAAHITQIASDLGHTVLGQAVTRDQAVERCLALKPKLLLADIQLADGSSGADAAAIITETLNIPVVFITAYPQLLLASRDGEPAYLIPKPFRNEMVKAVIGQALLQKAAVCAERK